MTTAEIISQGDEVITGQVVDSNAAWLAERLTDLGCDVIAHTTVGDTQEAITSALKTAAGRADITICTGGLGPTQDDLTAESVAEAFGRPLLLDEKALADITAFFARFRHPMAKSNEKQAWLPEGCIRIDNRWGTAPGFAVEEQGALLAFMPGVPREMFKMYQKRVEPMIEERFDLHPGTLVSLRTIGIGESNIQERLKDFVVPGVIVGYRSVLPENIIKLRFDHNFPADEMALIVADVQRLIGKYIFSIEGLAGKQGGSLVEVVGRVLSEQGETLAVAESCTGGALSALCTSLPGASNWFTEGVISYANEAKVDLLGVDPALIEEEGAVSEGVARQMAEGIQARAKSSYGIATTGIAGPSGGTKEKPVGTIHFAIATPEGTLHRKINLGRDRGHFQTMAPSIVLDQLRQHLLPGGC